MGVSTLVAVTIVKEDNLESVKNFLGATTYVRINMLADPPKMSSVNFFGVNGGENLLKGTELRKYSNRTITAIENGSERYLKFSAK